MSLQMHMKIDGVKGESKSFAFRGWAEVLSWNWGMTSTRKLAAELEGNKTSLNELSIVKSIGSDSPQIRLLFAQGNTIPKVEFSVIPVVGKREAPTKYINIKMEDVVIKSIVAGGNIEEDFFKEHITLLFDRVDFVYNTSIPASSTGEKGKSEEFKFGWNIPGNGEWEPEITV